MPFHKGCWHVCPDCGHRRWIKPGYAVVCDQLCGLKKKSLKKLDKGSEVC